MVNNNRHSGFSFLILSWIVFILVLLLSACTKGDPALAKKDGDAGAEAVDDARPNILLVLADDLGYSDIGAYGGEIRTPNLDTLAANGMMFTHYRVHMLCTPTRAMLLTGQNNHKVGIGTMADEFTDETRGQPGYETYLLPHVETLGQRLQQAGYETFISGKWDLGGRNNPQLWPVNRGFDQSFVLIEGSGSHFTDRGALVGLDHVTYVEGNHKVALADDFYSSKTYADKAIEFAQKAQENNKPFFGFLSFTAPHYPLEAPDEYLAANLGRYDSGYEAVRERRLQQQKQLGILPAHFQAAPPDPHWPSWEELSPQMRLLEARRMEIYAAMVEAMDHHLGRVIDHLKSTGQWENTVVLFFSDNGPEGGNPLDWGGQPWFEWAESSFDLSLENMGRRNSYVWQSPVWAEVSATPLRGFKSFPTEGGIRSPLIVTAPGLVNAGKMTSAQASIRDILPTVLDLAGIEPPTIEPGAGRSMLPFLTGQSSQIREPGDFLALEILARRAVVRDNWKLAWMNEPWGSQGKWMLFDLDADPAEQSDLAGQRPQVVTELTALWDSYAAANGIIPIEVYPMGYTNSFSHYTWLPPSMRDTVDAQ